MSIGITGTNMAGTVYSNVDTVLFDSNSGFDVTMLSSKSVLIGMNSTFKFWEVNGNTTPGSFLTANGIDTINFIPGNNVSITVDPTTSPQSIRFDVSNSGGGGGGGGGDTSANDWINTNIINPPPAIVFGTPVSTSTNIYIPWSYPSQINIGLLNVYVPAINTFSCNWSGNINGTVSRNNNILSNVSGSQNIKYTNLVQSTTFITGIVLTNTNANTGYQNIQFPQDTTGTLRWCYVVYSANFANLQTDTSNNLLTAWYSNYNLSTTPASVGYNIFLQAGVPSAPGQPTFGSQSNSSNPISTTVSCTAPQYADASNNTSTSIIQNYKFSYSTTGSLLRYGGAVVDNSKNVISASNSSVSITNLYPDCSYIFYASAQNNSTNQNYGELSSPNIIFTTYIMPSVQFGTLSFTPSASYSAKLVGANNSGNAANASVSNVIFSQQGNPWSSTAFTSPIHYSGNRSSSSSNLLTISSGITRGSSELGTTQTLNYGGFPATVPSQVSSTYLNIRPVTVTDSYSASASGYQGFYLQSSTRIDISSSVFTTSNDKTTVSLTQTQTGGGTNTSTYSFYYDTLTGSPTVSSFVTTLNTVNSIQISGIWILYGTTTLNATTTVTNIGTYFYNNSQILAYSTGQSETGLTNVTSGKNTNTLNNSVTFTNTGSGPAIQFSNASFSSSGIQIGVTAYNALGNTGTNNSNTILVIYDQPSYSFITNTTLYPSSINTINITTSASGYRISSGSSVGNTPQYVTALPPSSVNANSAYNNTTSIISTEELQISNGFYQTRGGNGYLNYTSYYYSPSSQNTLNYSTISSTGYRFSTFVWRVGTYPSNYVKVAFTINNISNVSDANGTPNVSGNNILCYYRLEDSANYGSFTSSFVNTTWINANTIINELTSGNYYVIGSSLLGGKNSTVTNTYSGNSLTVNALLPSFSVTNSNVFYIYLRVGLPMNVNVQFKNVTAILG